MLFKLGGKNADHHCSYTGDENLAKHKKAECVLRTGGRSQQVDSSKNQDGKRRPLHLP